MDNIRQKLEPVIEAFIKGLDSIEHKCIERQKDIEVELELSRQCNNGIKQQTIENTKNHEARSEKLNKEINKFKELQGELQMEIDSHKFSQKEIDLIHQNISDILKNTEAERSLAVDNRRKLDNTIKQYNDKTAFLKTDFDLLENKKKQLFDKIMINKAREKDLLVREEKLIRDNGEISIREINLKKKQQNLELEIKRASVNV